MSIQLGGFDYDDDNEDLHKKKRVSLDVFLKAIVEAVKNGGNSISVANELGISPQAVRQRCHKLRAKGAKVPQW
jgi:predicted ArsR family transcriptional regulator